MRDLHGNIVSYDVPGAGTDPGQGTHIYSQVPGGLFTGFYRDSSNVRHGFVASTRGYFVSFDNAGSTITQSFNINQTAETAGRFIDADGVSHGFVRTAAGTITSFDAPDAGTGSDQGTATYLVACLNQSGVVAGGYIDSTGVSHSYVRAADGTITEFDPTGYSASGTGSINAGGVIIGVGVDAAGANHGFVRAVEGTFTLFDVTGAGTGNGQGTLPSNINAGGVVIGNYIDSGNVNHGFVRYPGGGLVTFDAPGAGTCSGCGTFPITNNSGGRITGKWIDNNGVSHGFLAVFH
jgi:hypothetical protein